MVESVEAALDGIVVGVVEVVVIKVELLVKVVAVPIIVSILVCSAGFAIDLFEVEDDVAAFAMYFSAVDIITKGAAFGDNVSGSVIFTVDNATLPLVDKLSDIAIADVALAEVDPKVDFAGGTGLKVLLTVNEAETEFPAPVLLEELAAAEISFAELFLP